jgi:FkbM family methyltransferase
MLTTKTKVALAGAAYQIISFGRSVIGKSDRLIVERHGIGWDLDLREGIDFSIYLLGAFEPGTQATLKKLVKPGDVVFDIGANIGAHTLGIAQSVGPRGRVFAFEPADFAFEKLCRNLALNPDLAPHTFPQQILLAASPSDRSDPEIYASWPLRSSVSVHPKHRGRLVSTTKASVDTLDAFVARHILSRLDLVKIDVDGHELPVLQGARETLDRFRPTLVMEMSPYIHAEHNNSFADFIALLKSLHYSLRNADNGEAVPLDLAQLERLIPDGASINVVAQCRPHAKKTPC